MTEDQAREKWCPYARVFILTGDVNKPTRGAYGPMNRIGNEERITWQGSSNCIASDCMMWRSTDNEIKSNPVGPVEDGYARDASDYAPAGYCGLAGKP